MRSTTLCFRRVISILSPGTKGRVTNSNKPPTQFDARSLTAKPVAMPKMEFRPMMDLTLTPASIRSVSRQISIHRIQIPMPVPRLTAKFRARVSWTRPAILVSRGIGP